MAKKAATPKRGGTEHAFAVNASEKSGSHTEKCSPASTSSAVSASVIHASDGGSAIHWQRRDVTEDYDCRLNRKVAPPLRSGISSIADTSSHPSLPSVESVFRSAVSVPRGSFVDGSN